MSDDILNAVQVHSLIFDTYLYKNSYTTLDVIYDYETHLQDVDDAHHSTSIESFFKNACVAIRAP